MALITLNLGGSSTPTTTLTSTATSLVGGLTNTVTGVVGSALGSTGVTASVDAGASGATVNAGVGLGDINLLAGVTLGGAGSTSNSNSGLDVGVNVGSTAGTGGGLGVDLGLGGGSSTGSGGGGAGVGVGVSVGGGGITVTGGAGTGGGGSPGGTALPDPTTAFLNIFRTTDASQIPANVRTQLHTLSDQVASGAITAKQAILQIVDAAGAFTAVAETTYQFFTGLTPTAEGLSYLVHSEGNPADLSDSYYSAFNLENRYINFASNLGLHSDAAPAFAQVYGPMSFETAVATAYERIVGSAAATAAGIDPQAAEADIISRKAYFQEVAHERFGADNFDLSTKLAAVAYILDEAVKAHVGNYGEANQNFLFDLADGSAKFHVDLVGTYGHGTALDVT